MDSRADEDEEKFPVHTLVSITAALFVFIYINRPPPVHLENTAAFSSRAGSAFAAD